LHHGSPIAALVRPYTSSVSANDDSSKFFVALQLDLVTAFRGEERRRVGSDGLPWVVSLSCSHAAVRYDVQRPPPAHHRAPRPRQHQPTTRSATATAVVLAAVGIIANSVVAVASSVASTGDGPGFRKRLRQACRRRSCPDPVRWRPAEAPGFIKLQLVFFLNPRQLQPDLPSINKIVKLYFVRTTSIERPEDSRLLCSLPLCAPDTRPVVQTRVQSVPVRHGVAQWGSAGNENSPLQLPNTSPATTN
jgi:hypothetical protein